MDVRVSVARFPWALKYDCTALCLLGQNSHVIDTRNGKNHTPSLLTSRRPHSRGGITGSAHLKRSAKTPVLGQYAFCFLARNPDMFLTHKQWDWPTEERPGGTSPAHHSVKWLKMVLLESNSQPVIKTGRLKALIEKRIYLFNTSYPDAPKRILLNWLQHYERPRNGSLQKIYSLFHYYDNLCTPFLGWDLEFCCFCHRDTGFHMCHELQIICQIYC